ncbi:MAG: NAD-dependent epimerase/dehydratase family protein [Verrucomicrobiae bacterium]|nr:NAD-dependent epimerase/dehydratase family protein [Verrucomicrobiae bacterium]
MRCLVTGGAGYIGSHLVAKLLAQKHEVVVLDTRRPAADVAWHRADIRDRDAIRLKGFDAVFHLAALANARRCAEDPRLCYDTNVVGTANMVHAAFRDGVARFILASSSWVSTAQMGDPVDEATPFDLSNLNSIYGASKLIQEMVCVSHLAERGGPAFTIFRYGTSYGERMWSGLVVRAFMESAESRGVIPVMGDGNQYREFLYVGDMCDAQVLALGEVAGNKTYNLTGDQPVTILQLAQEVARHFPAKIQHVPARRAEPEPKRVLNGRAKSELGWKPSTSLADGIARCAAWWRSLTAEEKREPYWV